MFTNTPWLLYGANGRTGTLIAEEAVARGHRPVLAGRDGDSIRRLAERLDLTWAAGSPSEVGGSLHDVALLLDAAGPFGATSPALLRACLDAGVHYLDIANEIPVAEAVLAVDEAARNRGITVLPAVGFGTVASDGIARHVADQVPGAHQLELSIMLVTDGSSASAQASRTQALAAGGWTRRDGRLERARLGAGAHRQVTPIGDRTLVPVPTADLVVSARTTDAPNITVSMPVGMPPVVAELVMPALPLIARVTRNRRARPKPGRSDEGTATEESYVWARATSSDGEAVEAWARTGEGYAYTARAAVLAVEATLQSEPLGATTVARAFGPELSFNAGSELVAAA